MRVFIIAAVSADGFIAENHDQLVDWSSPEDKKLFVKLTKQAGVMVMGARTFDTIGRALPGRKTIVYTTNASKYQLPNVQPTQATPAELIDELKNQGYTSVAICGGRQIYDQFLHAELIDELYLVIEPILFGQGVGLLAKPLTTQLELLDTKSLNQNTLCLHYSVQTQPTTG